MATETQNPSGPVAPAGAWSLIDVVRSRVESYGDRTLYSFLADGVTVSSSLTYAELDHRARAIAAALQEQTLPGDRVLLGFPPGLEFIAAFFGCMYAGRVAVPSYPPQARRLERDLPRLRSVLADSAASAVLTNAALGSALEPALQQLPELRHVQVLVYEGIGLERAIDWRHPQIGGDSLAFLQYTSGSTAAPKGVMVSHSGVLANLEMIKLGFGIGDVPVGVGWLPAYHDMGLIGNCIEPVYVGGTSVLMPAAVFLMWPLRWLQAISRHRAHISGGPNFAYEWCVRKIKPEQCEGLDLSSWEVAFCGAEPIRASTLAAFAEKFGPYGFRASAFYPCYGLAEVTLFGTGARKGEGARVLEVDAAALEQGRVVEADAAAGGQSRALVSSGRAWLERRVVIADPETGVASGPDRVGEVWLGGPDVAQGYWGQPEASEETFRARLAETGEGPYLRTGDLGFVRDGQVYVTGRLKDLIILDGRNCYPQDLELSAERSHAALRPGGSAAFSVEVGAEERPVLVAELEREHSVPGPDGQAELESIARAIRQATAEQQGLQLHEVVLVRVGAVPKTTSGKVRRAATRAAYLADTLDGLLLRNTSAQRRPDS